MCVSVRCRLGGERGESGPDEAGELSGHGDDSLLGLDASEGHLLVAAVEAVHGAIGESDGLRGLPLAAVSQSGAEAGTVSVVPGGLDEEASDVGSFRSW